MPQGRHTSYTITLTPTESQALNRMLRQTTISAGMARRARLILLVAAGHTITDVAARCGIARRHVYKWVIRWDVWGIEGLHDDPRGQYVRTRKTGAHT